MPQPQEAGQGHYLSCLEQAALEALVGRIYAACATGTVLPQVKLKREAHACFALKGLETLKSVYATLDSSRPWICYWNLHSLALLGIRVDPGLAGRCIDFLARCQDPRGGFGGGPGQLAHLATTYAAVCALVTLGGKRAYDVIDRPAMLSFLLRAKDPSGGFRVHEDGEVDVRGSFTALAVAHMLNILTPELRKGAGEYIARCQSYEGGIGGEPGAEAHGGYTFCGLAAAVLIDQHHRLDLPSLLQWVVHRQGEMEGGFQGRTNKLVDGCYSFWQGAVFLILQRVMGTLEEQEERLIHLSDRHPVTAPTYSTSVGGGGEVPAPESGSATVRVKQERAGNRRTGVEQRIGEERRSDEGRRSGEARRSGEEQRGGGTAQGEMDVSPSEGPRDSNSRVGAGQGTASRDQPYGSCGSDQRQRLHVSGKQSDCDKVGKDRSTTPDCSGVQAGGADGGARAADEGAVQRGEVGVVESEGEPEVRESSVGRCTGMESAVAGPEGSGSVVDREGGGKGESSGCLGRGGGASGDWGRSGGEQSGGSRGKETTGARTAGKSEGGPSDGVRAESRGGAVGWEADGGGPWGHSVAEDEDQLLAAAEVFPPPDLAPRGRRLAVGVVIEEETAAAVFEEEPPAVLSPSQAARVRGERVAVGVGDGVAGEGQNSAAYHTGGAEARQVDSGGPGGDQRGARGAAARGADEQDSGNRFKVRGAGADGGVGPRGPVGLEEQASDPERPAASDEEKPVPTDMVRPAAPDEPRKWDANSIGEPEASVGDDSGVLWFWEGLMNPMALQAYLLLCCQVAEGGLRDKPGKMRDYYHTCYGLSGLSVAQHCRVPSLNQPPSPSHVFGSYDNVLEPIDPLCNVHLLRYQEALDYFEHFPSVP